MNPVIFTVIATTILGLIHYFGYKRVVRHFHFKPQTKRYYEIFIIINFIGVFGYILTRYFINVNNTLYYILSLSVGVAFVIFIVALFVELFHFILNRTPLDEQRRLFFKKSSDYAVLGFSGAYIAKATYNGTKLPAIKKFSLNQNLLNTPIKIAQISDMHIGGLIDREFVRQSVAMINAQNVDIVLITGDLVDAPLEYVTQSLEELKELKSKYGTYYILGNHEYFHEPLKTLEYIKKIGINVLENDSVIINNQFNLIGVNDLFGERIDVLKPDLTKATQNIDTTLPNLLLAHQPKFIKYLRSFKPHLMLSGHTHGGQIWPFKYLVSLDQPFVKGLHEISKNSYIYVNSGIGFWGPPMRLGSQAEITIIEWS